MASALVLGSSGMVGRAVAAQLLELGVKVVGTSRSRAEGDMLVLDALDPPPLESLLAGADLVVNAIGVLRSDPDYPALAYRLRAVQVNAVFPLLLAKAAARQGTRIVHISTDAVFGPVGDPVDERVDVSPTEPYGLTKALGEAEAERVVNIRCSVIGPAPGRPNGLWEWFVGQPPGAEVKGFTSRWSGVTSRQLAVLCGDLVDQAAFERVRAAGSNHHFVPNEPITKFELLALLGDALRPDVKVVRGDAAGMGRELMSSTRVLEDVFSGARGWRDAIRDAVAGTRTRSAGSLNRLASSLWPVLSCC
jgi:dTDP-4-dehydrorhamnose reductase